MPPPPEPEVRKDPLILDLNRDGKVSTTAGKRYFDMDANGVAERVSWAASGDASLAMDRDGDGRFEDHELATLDEASIESIGLSYTEQRTDDENGNQVVRTGQFVWSDGERGKASKFLLGQDTIHSLVGEKMDEPNDVVALPDLPGRGFLYSLHQAMVRDWSGELKRLTEQFAGEKDSAARRSLLERIMLKWSEVSKWLPLES